MFSKLYIILMLKAVLYYVVITGLPTHTTEVEHLVFEVHPRAASVSILNPGDAASQAFLWTSIALAVFTAFLQGLVTSLASMTETSNSWTFRFRLAKVEHWWWTMVSGLLMASLCFNILSFASGNSNEAISILVLSTTTLLAIVRYMLPAWRSRRYIRNRFLAWAGPSRTGIDANLKGFCGDSSDWFQMEQSAKKRGMKGVPSDAYGWHLTFVGGIKLDPTDILKSGVVNPQTISNMSAAPLSIYADGYENLASVSLLWGTHSGFRPRVSRSISSVPINLLKSQPFTNDGFTGEGLCLAMGILGRNKGLKPAEIVFKLDRDVSSFLENNSTWYPRPAKTLRSYYRKVLEDIYGGLKESFVSVAIELSLILMDAAPPAIQAWLLAGCEQQSMEVNKALQQAGATAEELRAHYESSYVSMILSINNMRDGKVGQHNHGQAQVVRPDIICLGLLLKARGLPRPSWWTNDSFRSLRVSEDNHLGFRWKEAAAKLLGLPTYPGGFVDKSWDGENSADEDRKLGRG